MGALGLACMGAFGEATPVACGMSPLYASTLPFVGAYMVGLTHRSAGSEPSVGALFAFPEEPTGGCVCPVLAVCPPAFASPAGGAFSFLGFMLWLSFPFASPPPLGLENPSRLSNALASIIINFSLAFACFTAFSLGLPSSLLFPLLT